MHQDLGFEQDLFPNLSRGGSSVRDGSCSPLVLGRTSVGLFSHSITLADATAQDASGTMRVDCQRFLRYDRLTRVTIFFSDLDKDNGQSSSAIPGSILERGHRAYVMPTTAKVTRTAE